MNTLDSYEKIIVKPDTYWQKLSKMPRRFRYHMNKIFDDLGLSFVPIILRFIIVFGLGISPFIIGAMGYMLRKVMS